MLAVDDMHQNLPPSEKDKYWTEEGFTIPYSLATAAETLKPFMGSTYDMRGSEDSLHLRIVETPVTPTPKDQTELYFPPAPQHPVTRTTSWKARGYNSCVSVETASLLTRK
uniref:Uncharacterized protein n=1 Tax=Anguilla anguilla TaxID=7936 RepID=A0A0E9XM59_ANGAN